MCQIPVRWRKASGGAPEMTATQMVPIDRDEEDMNREVELETFVRVRPSLQEASVSFRKMGTRL